MKLKFILIFSFLLAVKLINAQTYSQLFDKNEIFSNPAYYGFENKIDVGVSFIPSNNFLKIKGAPFQIFSFAEISLDSLHSGFGITHNYDFMGTLRNMHLGLGYNYVFKIHEKSKLRVGVNTSFQRNKLLASDFDLIDDGEDAIENEDIKNFSVPIFDLGLLYSFGSFSIGGSVCNIIIADSSTTSFMKLSLQSNYLFEINEKNKIQTSALFFYQKSAPPIWIINFKYIFDEKFYFATAFTNDYKYTLPIRFGVTLFDCLDLSYGRTISMKKYISGYQALSLAFKMRK
jgi:type IX secretion system PorP/SprF family membrane protein